MNLQVSRKRYQPEKLCEFFCAVFNGSISFGEKASKPCEDIKTFVGIFFSAEMHRQSQFFEHHLCPN